MKQASVLVLLVVGLLSFKTDKETVAILWVDNLQGDFSFSKKQSIECEAWCYEWAGTTSMKAKFISKDTVHCFTMMNEATHCSLHLVLTNNTCLPTIELRSIVLHGSRVYAYKSGYIKIDKAKWEKKILKAEFDFDFVNPENEKIIFWKGKVYCKIK